MERNYNIEPEIFLEPAPLLAPKLLGLELGTSLGGETSGLIVEVEAYTQDDPASHAFRGISQRNKAMFLPGGHLYVYLIYGIHHCVNIVAGPEGQGEAVLIRALEPVKGIELMKKRRATQNERLLTRGPGNLCQALGIDRKLQGVPILGEGETWLRAGIRPTADTVQFSSRIGISVAKERQWRFFIKENPFVSRA